MNYLQTELILLNLLRQSEEFVVSLLGLMPEPDAGSFYKRLSTLYEIFKTDKTGFAASSFRLGQVALFLKEYAALTKQNIDQVDIPEILSPAISWEDIEDKPEFFAPYSHFHKWEEIANKPVKYLPVTHQHIWNDVTDKPTTFPPATHTHETQAVAVAWSEVTDKPATFPPAEHTHEAQEDSTPAGSMIMFGGAVAPTGWLFCDGAAVSRETYAALFAAIGTTWGAGDGSTTFNLPDARGRSAMGAGQGSGLTARTLGQLLGVEKHALTADENGQHGHQEQDPNGPAYKGYSPGSGKLRLTGDSNGTATPLMTVTSGLGTPHNTVHPVFVANYIIKF